MTARGDLLELVCDAFRRLPPLSARYRYWTDLDRHQRALAEHRRRGTAGNVSMLLAPTRDPDRPEIERIDRIVVAARQGAYRQEREWPLKAGSLPVFGLSDGTTAWSPTMSGAYLSQPADRGHFPALNLLDPAWLAGYDCETTRPGTHNDRDVVVMHARLGASRNVPQSTPGLSPAEIDVLIDVQHGFLHRMTGFIDGEPYVVEELLDIILDPPLDPTKFRIDESEFQVFDLSEREQWHDTPSLPSRVGRAAMRPFRVVGRVLTGPCRRSRHRPS